MLLVVYTKTLQEVTMKLKMVTDFLGGRTFTKRV